MKIAIHFSDNSFSSRWVKYCEENKLNYKIVDAFDSNIIEQLNEVDVFMWHHSHTESKDILTAKKILFALEHAGIKVFPNFKTGWHFDDKVAQKYLLEAIRAPIVPSHIFYNKKKAIDWARETSYPKVFKLKGGAGATNVKLVKDFSNAKKLIDKSFDKGFEQFDRLNYLKERFNKFKNGKDTLVGFFKGIYRLFVIPEFSKNIPPEKGYVYFQDFIANNDSDIRVIVIGEKAFAIKRLVREDDFRASGSGKIIYSKNEVDENLIKISFEVGKKLESDCTAFDFVFDNGTPLIVEISYGFSVSAYDMCEGYWDADLVWHEGNFNPQFWMMENIINGIK